MKSIFLSLFVTSLFATGVSLADKRSEHAERPAPTVTAPTPKAEAQPTGAGCTLLRPLNWNVNINSCAEGATTQLPMVDGQEYTATSVGGPLYGLGSITVRCSNGEIVTVRKSCRGGSGVPQ